MEWLTQAYAAFPLLLWILGSVLACLLGTNLLWFLDGRDFWRGPDRRWLQEAGRFFFFLGIPYLALGGWPRRPFQGLLSPEDLGLVGFTPPATGWTVTRWLGAIGTALGLGLGALLILTLAWANANRKSDAHRVRFPSQPWWMLPVDVLYLEVHWAFYRGALAVLLDDVYAGVFLGLGLVYIEWGLNPFWRRGWRLPSLAAGQWLHAALALLVALMFLLTRNLWGCLAVHLLLELFFFQLGRERPTFHPAD